MEHQVDECGGFVNCGSIRHTLEYNFRNMRVVCFYTICYKALKGGMCTYLRVSIDSYCF